jgi:hypothetical protein
MGEVSEMMLDGTLCEMCGVYLEPEHYGGSEEVPRYCSEECAKDRDGLYAWRHQCESRPKLKKFKTMMDAP